MSSTQFLWDFLKCLTLQSLILPCDSHKQFKKLPKNHPYQQGSECPLVVVSVSAVQLKEWSHLEEGCPSRQHVEMLPQLCVDADDLANVAEDRHDDVIRNEAGLSRRNLEQLKKIGSQTSILFVSDRI